MKRDIDLERMILIKIEEQYQAGQKWLLDFSIDGYPMEVVAEHCKLLYQQGLIENYDEARSMSGLSLFRITNLTASGYDYLELIRNDDVWEQTKKKVEEKKLPKTIEFLAKIAGIFTGNAISEMNP